MLFNSIEFALFLPIVFAIYWLIGKERKDAQNLLLLVSSYVFYGWWDWRFLLLILISSIVDFVLAKRIDNSQSTRTKKRLLLLSIAVNIGILSYFKYSNFFLDSLAESFTFLGKSIDISRLEIILPVGISFYTFQTLSYTIDVYRGKLKSTNKLIQFFSYVSFFPQLVAGPIERATNLLPQFNKIRELNKRGFVIGVNLIVLGLVKKMVIADNCAIIADQVFNNYEGLSSFEIMGGVLAFAFQIYGDFSGYSDIAIGVASLFGFTLMTNFRTPYFSKNIAHFWQRWHISLSTWFRDYVYISLGGNRVSKIITIRNIFIVFVISGFWHGANWTFLLWGAFHGLLYLILHIKEDFFKTALNTPITKYLGVILTFILVNIGWVFFRSSSVAESFNILEVMFSFKGNFDFVEFHHLIALFVVCMLAGLDYLIRKKEQLVFSNSFSQISFFSLSIVLIVFFGNFTDSKEFIYFQF
jgi:alginate O-acetyltransferase complex protein AlgI